MSTFTCKRSDEKMNVFPSSVSSHWKKKKKIWILLLMTLISCVSAGRFEVKVTRSFYQAEENQNVTLEWTFTPKADGSLQNLYIYCWMSSDHTVNVSVLFYQQDGVEVSVSQGEQFVGRVHCDQDVLKEGRLRLHVSSLRTGDSGQYKCQVLSEDGRDDDGCHLNVSAAAHEPETQRPTVRPEAESRARVGLYIALGLFASAVLASFCLQKCFMKSFDKRQTLNDPSMTCSTWLEQEIPVFRHAFSMCSF